MSVIDAQVHLAPDDTVEALLSEMDGAGVDAALILNQSRYGPDNSHQLAAVAAAPERLALVAGIDPTRRAVREELAELSATPGVVGVRIVVNPPQALVTPGLSAKTIERIRADIAFWESGGYDEALVALEERGCVLCLYAPYRTEEIASLAMSHPKLRIVVDHLNLLHNPAAHLTRAEAERELVGALALSAHPNVSMKATGMPAVSDAPYPYQDIWDAVAETITAFSLDRVMWGSDFTALRERCSYASAVNYVGEMTMDKADRDAFMGGTLAATFGWPVQ